VWRCDSLLGSRARVPRIASSADDAGMGASAHFPGSKRLLIPQAPRLPPQTLHVCLHQNAGSEGAGLMLEADLRIREHPGSP
jgi:hypothetical protein